MGKGELNRRISELISVSKSKAEIYRELEPEVPEKLKFWVMLKVFLSVQPEILNKYRRYNNVLVVILITQLIFSLHFFPLKSDWEENSKIIFLSASIIYLILMVGVFRYKLICYYSLAVFCFSNIVLGIPHLFTLMWPKILISITINLTQIIFTIWLVNRLFPDVADKHKESKRKMLFHVPGKF